MIARPDPAKYRFVMRLRDIGITDSRVLAAVETTPREAFLPDALKDLAYADRPLPIAEGQTISQPSLVAIMTQALELAPEHKALEIGTGSGYQTAILAKLARRVFTIERWPALFESARETLAALGIANVAFRLADGYEGWIEAAPFDRILVTAATPERPDALIGSLKLGGVMVAPVGDRGGQMLMRYRRTAEGTVEEALTAVRFVPMLPGLGKSD